MALPRMRTIPQTVQELKKEDENTAITEHSLRRLVKCGVIPCVTTGRKVLICLDTVMDYLGKPRLSETTEVKTRDPIKITRYETAVNSIRRI